MVITENRSTAFRISNRAARSAKILGRSLPQLVRLSLQELVDEAGLKLKVDVATAQSRLDRIGDGLPGVHRQEERATNGPWGWPPPFVPCFPSALPSFDRLPPTTFQTFRATSSLI